MALKFQEIDSDDYKEILQLSIIRDAENIDEGILGIDSAGLRTFVIESLLEKTNPEYLAQLLEFMRKIIHDMIDTKIDQSICFCNIVHEGKIPANKLKEAYDLQKLPSDNIKK